MFRLVAPSVFSRFLKAFGKNDMKHFLAFLVAALILPGCGAGTPTPTIDPNAPAAGEPTPDAETLMDPAAFDNYAAEQDAAAE